MTVKRTSRLHSRARALLLTSSVALVMTGACSSSDERQRAIQLAGGCLINSDCDKLLICAFGRCHEECDEDRDCEHDLRCVKSEEPGLFVCQLEDETICKSNEHCPGDQVCGVDLECRDSCKDDADCLESTQVCSVSNECASTDPERDLLDERGHIIPFDPDSPGEGGTGGSSGGIAGAGATSGSGGTAAMGATSGSGGTSGTDAGGNVGSGGEVPTTQGGAGASATGGTGNEAGGPTGSDVDFEEPTGPEVVDNDTREKAVAIQTGARLRIEEQDEDWLSYTPPNDGRGHVVTLRLEQDAGVHTVLNVYASSGNNHLGGSALGQGETRSVYVTVGPGTPISMVFTSAGAADGMVQVSLEDVAEDDEHEPNNSEEEPTPITLGQVVSGQLLAPFVSKTESIREDWFEVELAAGSATFELLSVPDQGQMQVLRQNAQGVLTSMGTTQPGATTAFPMTNLTAGTYKFNIVPWAETVKSYAIDVKPAYLTEPYSFKITQ